MPLRGTANQAPDRERLPTIPGRKRYTRETLTTQTRQRRIRRYRRTLIAVTTRPSHCCGLVRTEVCAVLTQAVNGGL
jgi:hypothetical protein